MHVERGFGLKWNNILQAMSRIECGASASDREVMIVRESEHDSSISGVRYCMQ